MVKCNDNCCESRGTDVKTFKQIKRIVIGCIAIFSCLLKLVHAGWFSHQNQDEKSITPPKGFKWDVNQKNSRIEQEFIIKEYQGYYFCLGIGSKKYPNDKDDQSWRQDQNVLGFIRTSEYPLVIPVHLQIERLDNKGNAILVEDLVKEKLRRRSGGYLLTWTIAMVKLEPGKYRATATTLKDTALPEGIGTYLYIGVGPK
jgi:hypothetical protein